jgi:uncharacterized protein YjiS (DUF1127 family)
MSTIEFRPTMTAGSFAKAHAESITRGAELVQLLIAVIRVARKRARDRAELAQMGDLALQDLGLNPRTAWHDVRRPFRQDVQEAWREVARSQYR